MAENVAEQTGETQAPSLRVAWLCGLGAAVFGLAGILGWLINLPVLHSIIPGYTPIAFSMAIIAVLLGGVQMLLCRPLPRPATVALLVLTAFITVFSLLEVILLITGIDLTIENALLRRFPALYSQPNVHISPVAGIIVFFIASMQSLLLYGRLTGRLTHRQANLIGIVGMLITIGSILFFLSYLFRTPWLYGTIYIPIAFTATMVTLLLGIGLIVLAGRHTIPLLWFVGASTRARLLRSFLPLTALVMLLLSLAQFFVIRLTRLNPAITTAVLIILFEIIIGFVILHVARVIGNQIDRAEEERRRAADELRESRERLRTAIASADMGTWSVDVPQELVYWDARSQELFGMSGVDVAPLEEVLTHILDEDLPLVRERIAAALNPASDGRYDIEYRTRDARGDVHWVRATGQVLFEGEGPNRHPIRFIGVLMDMTDRKRAEEELRQLTATLEQRVQARTAALEAANKELEAFSYSVSHDLRAPLRGIDGFSRVLLEQYFDRLDERGRDYLTRVRNASQRMGRLIDDMLNLSRIGRREMVRKTVNLSEIAASIIEDLRQRDPARKVEAIITPDLLVNGDPDLLRIVMDNLIGNAWKFTGQRETVRIEVGVTTRDGERVYYVRDNGAGFDMAYADKLFTPFQRLHTEAEFPGTGIGLAIVQRIIARHGGRVWAEGEEGKGATIYFTLGESE